MLFLHNSYGTLEFPDCGNLVGIDCMGNLRWANIEPSMHFRKTNTDPSVHSRKANTDLSMYFRKVAPRDFPWASPSGNLSEQPCQHLENPVHPSSFTWMNVYVCLCVCLCLSLFVFVCFCLSAFVYMSVSVFVCLSVCIGLSVSVCLCVCQCLYAPDFFCFFKLYFTAFCYI